MIEKLVKDKNRIIWARLGDYNNPRKILYLPEDYRKEALCKAHDGIFGLCNTTLKTYLKITSSYFSPKVYQDIEKYTCTCL
jgi:hypothetical protein